MHADNILLQSQQRVQQQKNQKQLQDNREKEQQRKLDTRRKMIIGSIIYRCFPEVKKLQPKRTAAADKVEFAELEEFFTAVASDDKYIELLKEKLL